MSQLRQHRDVCIAPAPNRNMASSFGQRRISGREPFRGVGDMRTSMRRPVGVKSDSWAASSSSVPFLSSLFRRAKPRRQPRVYSHFVGNSLRDQVHAGITMSEIRLFRWSSPSVVARRSQGSRVKLRTACEPALWERTSFGDCSRTVTSSSSS